MPPVNVIGLTSIPVEKLKIEPLLLMPLAKLVVPPTTIPTAFPALPIRAMTPLLVTPPAKLLLSIT